MFGLALLFSCCSSLWNSSINGAWSQTFSSYVSVGRQTPRRSFTSYTIKKMMDYMHIRVMIEVNNSMHCSRYISIETSNRLVKWEYKLNGTCCPKTCTNSMHFSRYFRIDDRNVMELQNNYIQYTLSGAES